jgi:DNA-binding transcriptional LysR family regulator
VAPLLDVRHLQAIVAVADLGSVTAAASRLGIVQQALSRTVAEAERLAGVAVFERRARGMRLTAAGREVVFAARVALDAVRAVPATAGRIAPGDVAEVERPLRIGLADCGHPAAVLPHALRALRFLGIPYVAVPLPAARHSQALRDGLLDVGFWVGFTHTVTQAVHGVAEVTVLAEEPLLGVLFPADHPLAAEPVVAPDALRGLPLLEVPYRLFAHELDDQFARLGAAGWHGRPAHEIEHGLLIAQMIVAGAGWAHVAEVNGALVPPGVAYRPLASGGGTPFVAHLLVHETARTRAAPLAAMLVDLCAAAAREAAATLRAPVASSPA